MDVPRGEVGEVAELSWESLLRPNCVVAVRCLNCFLELLCVKPVEWNISFPKDLRRKSTDLQILRLWSIPEDMILVPAELKSALRTNEMSVLLLSANQSSPLPENLVPVPLHAAENRDVVLGFDVPQPHRVVLN